MQKTILSSKGQIIIPKQMRERHNWCPGTRFFIEDTEDGLLLKIEKGESEVTVESLRGCISYNGPPITVEEMSSAVDEEIRSRWLQRKS